MCIVVDINTIPKVFNNTNIEHEKFKPVFKWIFEDIGKLVIGGSSYNQELGRMHNYIKVINILRDKNKVIKIDDKNVDKEEKRIIAFLNDDKCDDPHIIALLKISQCKILCSNDDRMFPYSILR